MSKWMSTLTLAGVVAVGLPACATKKFVRNSVGEVNSKVDNLTQSVEETQERTRKNEGAINDVNTKAQAAQGAADAGYFTAHCGRVVSSDEARAIETGFLAAYRWQYIHSGAGHPHFARVLTSLITERQGQRIQAALATLH